MARDFPGVNSNFLNVPDPGTMDGLSNFSECAWVNWDALVDFATPLTKHSADNNRVGISLAGAGAGDNNDLLFMVANGSNTYGFSSSSPVVVGTWTHVALTFDGSGADNPSKLKGYADGSNLTLTFGGTIPTTLPTNDADIVIGAQNSLRATNARICEVAFWNVTLTAADITALARGVSPILIRPDALLHYWPLIGRYSPEIDRIFASNMTITGSVPVGAHTRIYQPRRRSVHAVPAVAAAGFGPMFMGS